MSLSDHNCEECSYWDDINGCWAGQETLGSVDIACPKYCGPDEDDFQGEHVMSKEKGYWGIWCGTGSGEAFVCRVPAQDHADDSDMILTSWLGEEWVEPPSGKTIAIVRAKYIEVDCNEGGTGPAHYELDFIRWE